MAPKLRGRRSETTHQPCCVCGMKDARGLVAVELLSGESVSLCGSHELMHRRAGGRAKSASDLRVMLGERREMDRRATGEVDELAASLTAAFTNERRAADRRTA